MTLEEKALKSKRQSDSIKEALTKKSPEEKALQSKRQSDSAKKRHINTTNEEKNKNIKKRLDTLNNKSIIEKEQSINKQKTTWANKSQEEKNKINKTKGRIRNGANNPYYIHLRVEEEKFIEEQRLIGMYLKKIPEALYKQFGRIVSVSVIRRVLKLK